MGFAKLSGTSFQLNIGLIAEDTSEHLLGIKHARTRIFKRASRFSSAQFPFRHRGLDPVKALDISKVGMTMPKYLGALPRARQ